MLLGHTTQLSPKVSQSCHTLTFTGDAWLLNDLANENSRVSRANPDSGKTLPAASQTTDKAVLVVAPVAAGMDELIRTSTIVKTSMAGSQRHGCSGEQSRQSLVLDAVLPHPQPLPEPSGFTFRHHMVAWDFRCSGYTSTSPILAKFSIARQWVFY